MPMVALFLFLSRTPVLKVMVEKQFGLAPVACHLIKWISGSVIVVGGMNTVTGATATVQLLEGYNNTTGYVGEYFRLSFASTQYTVGSYKLGGAAPSGLALSPNVNEFGVGTVDGYPTKAGVYNLDIYAYKEKDRTGDSTLLALTVFIKERGPNIKKQPLSASIPWGTSHGLELVLESSGTATFQWRKDGVDIPGATTSTHNISEATSISAGLYDVAVTQDGITVTSSPASIAVMASGMQVWKESAFPDPFDPKTEPEQDPDKDGLINLVEFAVGTDPLEPSVAQLPTVRRERSVFGDYVVYTFARNPLAEGIVIGAEYSESLGSPVWGQVVNYANGFIVEDSNSAFVVKVPSEAKCFIRFKVSDS